MKKDFLASDSFARIFKWGAVTILGFSTLFWSYLGARLHQANADQLINAYLFDDRLTFQQALLPGSHSFLLKWPLFYLVRLFDFSDAIYIGLTILAALAAVAGLVLLLHKIEKRPVYFGAICLALASLLLMIPAQPYAGALLPINMAMLATRNIEYLFFIAAIACVMRTPSLRSWWSIGALLISTLLFASDKLFLPLAIGSSVILFLLYGLRRDKKLLIFAGRWLACALAAAVAASSLLWVITHTGIVTITNGGGSSTNPYAITNSFYDWIIGSLYAVIHTFTNFGANPAVQTTILVDIPMAALQGLVSPTGPAYIVNAALLLGCLYASYRIVTGTIKQKNNVSVSKAYMITLAMLAATVVSYAAFVATKHYYAADGRYLAIGFFSFTLAGVTWIRQENIRLKHLLIACSIILASNVIALPSLLHAYRDSVAAQSIFQSRNERIMRILKKRPVDILVGDYWRVVPTRQLSSSDITILPLGGCTIPRDTLTSRKWQPNLQKTNFAYVLSLDASATDYPRCTYDEVVRHYGAPDDIATVSLNGNQPTELLLFYNRRQ